MTHINKDGKTIRMTNWLLKRDLKNKQDPYSAFKKAFDREFAYYEKNWPFVKHEGSFRIFISMFHNFKIVRRIIGGIWVKGDTFGIWLKTNEHFKKEWLENHHHEIWP